MSGSKTQFQAGEFFLYDASREFHVKITKTVIKYFFICLFLLLYCMDNI